MNFLVGGLEIVDGSRRRGIIRFSLCYVGAGARLRRLLKET